jgi:hypothetical protein
MLLCRGLSLRPTVTFVARRKKSIAPTSGPMNQVERRNVEGSRRGRMPYADSSCVSQPRERERDSVESARGSNAFMSGEGEIGFSIHPLAAGAVKAAGRSLAATWNGE